MELFSQRAGLRPNVKELQDDYMDEDLRNGLWNCLTAHIWSRWSPSDFAGNHTADARRVVQVARRVWMDLFKLRIDEMPDFGQAQYGQSAHGTIRGHFLNCHWYECYDFIEFILPLEQELWDNDIASSFNFILTRENAAYRVLQGRITKITDEYEIAEVNSAVQGGPAACREHLQKALVFLSDREQPDYRNSIKESISAVEAVCQFISGKPKATLGQCLAKVEADGYLHPAFKDALSKLYGYTSDGGGIRHALSEDSHSPAFSEAKFMLVASSAFVNYMLTKASELNLAEPN